MVSSLKSEFRRSNAVFLFFFFSFHFISLFLHVHRDLSEESKDEFTAWDQQISRIISVTVVGTGDWRSGKVSGPAEALARLLP